LQSREVILNLTGNNPELKLVLTGDWHFGHHSFLEDGFSKMLNYIKQYDARVLITGDIFEMAVKDTAHTPGEAKDEYTSVITEVYEKLKPVKNNIDGIVVGNHDLRGKRNAGLEPTELLATMLDIKDSFLNYQGLVHYRIKYAHNCKASFDVCLWHGNGRASTEKAAFDLMFKMTRRIDADIYAMGHTHFLIDTIKRRKYYNPYKHRLDWKYTYFINTGSFMDYDENYADMAGHEPKIPGFMVLHITFNKYGVHNFKVERVIV